MSKNIKSSNHVFVIGEIGQNHNGSVEIAKLIVDLVSRKPKAATFNLEFESIDAVKLTKRDLNQELTNSEMSRIYESPHSFGRTYGEHRKKLELSDEDHFEIYKYAKSLGLKFVETVCNPGALSVLKYFTPDFFKIASRDLTNIPLLHEVAKTKIPTIISTGMHGEVEIEEAVSIFDSHGTELSILHCVSEYPTHPDHVNLASIPYLKSKYPDKVIGYSDHTVGISMPVAAVAIGARIIEKHITIDREMKGSDQEGSLGPDGVRRMIRDIRMLERSIGEEGIFVSEATENARKKLERSIASKREVSVGEEIKESDIWLLSPGTGLRWNERHKIINKKCVKKIPINEIITTDMVET
ncbi:MAG: N-acetylneuraminate synthase family protein [Leptospira sp.]|nr:N-acetylneuraminate synthase family protein [Leptospira sp.]